MIVVGLACARLRAEPDADVHEQETQSLLTEREKLALLLTPDDPGNDSVDPELQRQMNELTQGQGKWGYEFVWVNPRGAPEVLSERNPNQALLPASTMKLFTGWFGFVRRAKPNSYLGKMLAHSVNSMAKAVLRACGGAAALETFLVGRGLPLKDAFVAVDGSGFSREDRATARLEVNLLADILGSQDYDQFKRLLAQPRRPGTLQGRLREFSGSLYAKTGTLSRTGVVSLAGFLETPNGTVLFSVIVNSLTTSVDGARKTIDEMVKRHGVAVASRRQLSLPDSGYASRNFFLPANPSSVPW